MVTAAEIGNIGEEKATNYLIEKGFTIVDTNYQKPSHFYDVLVSKEDKLYAVNIKYTQSEIGAFGIRVANIKRLLKYCNDTGACIMFLFAYNDNFAIFLLNGGYSHWYDLSKTKKQIRNKVQKPPAINRDEPCKKCGLNLFHKAGTSLRRKGLYQIYKCNNCGTHQNGELLYCSLKRPWGTEHLIP